MEHLLTQVVALFKKENYRFTIHAERERENDELTLKDIQECFLNGKIEIIENYPKDPRGHSFLLLGFTNRGVAVHLVCAIHELELIIITVYKPSNGKWKNWRERI